MFLAHFWSIFPSFGAKIVFLENLAPSRTTSYGFLEPCQDLEKTNNTIPRKRPDRRKDGWKDGRTDRPYFIEPFRLPPGFQKMLNVSRVNNKNTRKTSMKSFWYLHEHISHFLLVLLLLTLNISLFAGN